MKTVTATQASRGFASLLDEVEHGESVIITRAGRQIARLVPSPAANGADVIAFLTAACVDEAFAGDVDRATAATWDGPVWADD